MTSLEEQAYGRRRWRRRGGGGEEEEEEEEEEERRRRRGGGRGKAKKKRRRKRKGEEEAEEEAKKNKRRRANDNGDNDNDDDHDNSDNGDEEDHDAEEQEEAEEEEEDEVEKIARRYVAGRKRRRSRSTHDNDEGRILGSSGRCGSSLSVGTGQGEQIPRHGVASLLNADLVQGSRRVVAATRAWGRRSELDAMAQPIQLSIRYVAKDWRKTFKFGPEMYVTEAIATCLAEFKCGDRDNNFPPHQQYGLFLVRNKVRLRAPLGGRGWPGACPADASRSRRACRAPGCQASSSTSAAGWLEPTTLLSHYVIGPLVRGPPPALFGARAWLTPPRCSRCPPRPAPGLDRVPQPLRLYPAAGTPAEGSGPETT